MKKAFLLQVLLFSTLTFAQVGINTTAPAADLEIVGRNVTTGPFTNGNVHVRTTDNYAADIGASLTFGGMFGPGFTRNFASIEARKTNSDLFDQNGYLQFKTLGVGSLLERMRITNTGNVGIGTSIPLDRLHIIGNIRMIDGNQAAGKVLTSDVNGTASWALPTSIASGTLDQAYDFGGAGLGKTITADAGAVLINGTDGLVSTGTFNSGAIVPSGAGTRMVWNPRKAAFRAGTIVGTIWDDTNTGIYSAAFGTNNTASGNASAAFGFANNASGHGATTFGVESIASGNYSTTFGFINSASGTNSTVFGEFSTSSGTNSASFGAGNISSGHNSITFGYKNSSKSFSETVLGIGATEYTPTTNGETQFRTANATDRLFVVGNSIDVNNNSIVDIAERSDAMIVLKNGLTRLPSTTNAMITAADGKAVVTKEYLLGNTSGTLDQAYDFGGAGLGKTITADAGAVLINGTDGLVSTGTVNSGAIVPSGTGTRMVWNPRKAAFRAGQAAGSDWDDVNVGQNSIAMGYGTIASGNSSIALGSTSSALGMGSVAFGWSANANATQSIAFGLATNASALYSTAFGYQTRTLGRASTSYGVSNEAESYGEVVLGIGATSYTSSGNGRNQFRATNVTDRLFVIGNAIDADNDDTVDDSERSDAMIILKNGLTRLPSTTNAMITAADGKAVVTKEYLQSTITAWDLTGNAGTNATTNFIGTTDNQAFSVRTDNALRARILATGEFGIGTPTPTQNLEISGPAGTTVTRIANTSATGTSSNVALDFFRRTNANTDWRIYNIGPNLSIGNSGDDLATVNDLYQFQGARFMPMNDAAQSLGQATNRWNTLFASNGTINTSDARQKKNIQNLNYGLKDLMKLRPVSFEWNKDDGSGTKLGLIAQELQQILPEVVRDWDWQEDEKGNRTKVTAASLGVFYSDIIPVLIKATQEQQQIIDKQKQEIVQLKQQFQEQTAAILQRLNQLENK